MKACSSQLKTTQEHQWSGTCHLSRNSLAKSRLASTGRSSFTSGIATTFVCRRRSAHAWNLRVKENAGLQRCGKLVVLKLKTVLMLLRSLKNWGCWICISNRIQLKRWGNWFNTTLKTSSNLTHQWTKLQGKLFGLASLKVSWTTVTLAEHTLMISLFLKKTCLSHQKQKTASSSKTQLRLPWTS